jgi:hypothetical protein
MEHSFVVGAARSAMQATHCLSDCVLLLQQAHILFLFISYICPAKKPV